MTCYIVEVAWLEGHAGFVGDFTQCASLPCRRYNRKPMQYRGVTIQKTFAEAFRMWAARLIVTALDDHWLDAAAREVTGYGASVIGCDCEAAVERHLSPSETPDGRPGASILFFAFNADKLAKAVVNRTGQCLMTCPTSAVFDGLPDAPAPGQSDDATRFELGGRLRYFGDGHQKSKVIAGKRYWRVPVMDGEWVVQEDAGAVKAIGGGNFLLCGPSQTRTLAAARRAVDAIAPLPEVITPFPGGVVRSGSKVGSRYKGMFASTNDAFCPTLRSRVASELPDGAACVYEIVINGLSQAAIAHAMRTGMQAACHNLGDLIALSAGNYGGKLGKFHFHLHDVMGAPS